MRGASYSAFGGPITVGELPEPPVDGGDAAIEVRATGICRSDWHGWHGHDPDIRALPHVPGHEFAGVVAGIGPEVSRWTPGDRVAVPFISSCGRCEYCVAGQAQVCPHQTQPGFTHWGSFAERVVVRNADVNLVELPSSVGFEAAAALGCRFSTAYHAVVDQGGVTKGDWVAIYGCGGVGLSAIMIAAALGAKPVGVDPKRAARDLALQAGAMLVYDPDEAREYLPLLGGDGPRVTVDAVGAPGVVADGIGALRRRGRHVQVGLLPGPGGLGDVAAGRIVAHELSIVGSHGIARSGLETVLELTTRGELRPERLIGRRVDLVGGVETLTHLDEDPTPGFTVITEF